MKNILVIGSARSFVESRQGLFRRGNFDVYTTDNAEDALAVLGDRGADLVITDLNNRDIPGDQLIEKIAEVTGRRNIPVIVLSSDRDRDIQRCRTCGAADYIAGTVTAVDLFAKTARLLGIAQRKDYRVLTKVSVDGRFGALGTVPFFGTIKDISASGMLLETGKTFPVGEHVTCSFFLGVRNLSVTGEVMRVTDDLCGHQYGIRFQDLDRETEMAIMEFVNQARSRA